MPRLNIFVKYSLLAISLQSCQKTTSEGSSSSLSELQRQAKAEGWRFEVTDNEFARRFEAEGRVFTGLDASKADVDGLMLTNYGEDDENLSEENVVLPKRLDWREFDAVTPIKNQGQCGSCWAFGTVAAMESSIAVQTGRKGIDLSEQHLVSCGKYGTCGGGYYAFGHFEKYGVVYEEDFKYQARNVSCNRSAPTREKAVDWGYAGGRRGNPSIDDIKRAIVKYGPVAATVAVAGAWQNYGGGLYDNCVYSGTNHIVAIVGWDQKEGEDVWIVKNSFGTRWGDQGYMYSKMTDSRGRKCNNLGESAAYVVYKGEQSTPLAQ